jgi:hypothetical protein
MNNHYTYVIKHNNVPIWVGVGTGSRYKIKTHCHRGTVPTAKRDYILLHRHEITSEIVLENTSVEAARQKEKDLITKYGLRCDDKGGTLFNLTYGGNNFGHEIFSPTVRKRITTKRYKTLQDYMATTKAWPEKLGRPNISIAKALAKHPDRTTIIER